MNLNVYAADKKKEIFAQLEAGHAPGQGAFPEASLRDARSKNLKVQMGSTRYEPMSIILEFIFPDPSGASVVLPVTLEAPERIVFLPVPEWVIESIWQGEIDGSYHFVSESLALVQRFEEELAVGHNERWFGKRQPTHRE